MATKRPKLYTSVLRQEDGSWQRDDMPTTLKEAKKSSQFNRCLAGISTQIMPANEQEIRNWEEENGLVDSVISETSEQPGASPAVLPLKENS